jgi:hypothetical protein
VQGLGWRSYTAALRALVEIVERSERLALLRRNFLDLRS